MQGHSSSVSAVVDFYGVSSLPDMRPGGVSMGGSADPDLLAAASPLGYVTAGAAPFLLIHGDSDGLVPLSQSELLAAALTEAGVRNELIAVEGGDHCFFFAEDRVDGILRTAVDYFAREL